jgi:hypothetical protein
VPEKVTALKRRIAPSFPLTLELVDDGGAKFTQTFRLTFNMNVGANVQEKTGLRITDFSIWTHLADPAVIRAMLWAAILPLHPEFDTVDAQGEPSDEGLEVIGSYIDDSSADPVFDALWGAYLLYLSPMNRVAAEKWRAAMEAKAKDKREGPEEVPLAPAPATMPASPSTGSISGLSLDTTSDSPIANSAS